MSLPRTLVKENEVGSPGSVWVNNNGRFPINVQPSGLSLMTIEPDTGLLFRSGTIINVQKAKTPDFYEPVKL